MQEQLTVQLPGGAEGGPQLGLLKAGLSHEPQQRCPLVTCQVAPLALLPPALLLLPWALFLLLVPRALLLPILLLLALLPVTPLLLLLLMGMLMPAPAATPPPSCGKG
jgi:hypothetical protein